MNDRTYVTEDSTARKAAQNPFETARSKAPQPESRNLNWTGPAALVGIAVAAMLIYALVIL